MYLDGFENIKVELKYCERCGGLWMRKVNSGDIFCAGCALEMANMGAPQRKRSRPKLPVNIGKIDIKAQIDEGFVPLVAYGNVSRGEA